MVYLSVEWDETELIFFVFKYPDYNIIMVSTFSGLTVTEGQKEEIIRVNGEVVKFKYPEVVADHYIYMGAAKIKLLEA